VEAQRASRLAVAHGKKLILTKHCKVNDFCGTPDAAALLTLEIKERNLTFTSPDDFPYDTVFVDDLRGLGREQLSPFAYVFVSRKTVVRDTTRGHEMGMLVAPRKHLRRSEELQKYLVPHHSLELIDGDTSAFVVGGGKAEERERYVEKTSPDLGGRDRKTAPPTREHMG
jgi:hypothetical protein